MCIQRGRAERPAPLSVQVSRGIAPGPIGPTLAAGPIQPTKSSVAGLVLCHQLPYDKMRSQRATLIDVRTTIRIDDGLYRKVKERAARNGMTVGEVIENALRDALRPARRTTPVDELPVFGGSGTYPGVDLTDTASLRDLMDEESALDALR